MNNDYIAKGNINSMLSGAKLTVHDIASKGTMDADRLEEFLDEVYAPPNSGKGAMPQGNGMHVNVVNIPNPDMSGSDEEVRLRSVAKEAADAVAADPKLMKEVAAMSRLSSDKDDADKLDDMVDHVNDPNLARLLRSNVNVDQALTGEHS